ncbi:PIN domain-containing protein [Candidatus Woesearchaeota archaeon]|nr:PIN domain-containing protein [Candidatus Woesearchaeota archaeon]
MVIFLDTYAIIEIDKGNLNYKKYSLESTETITTLFNITELYFYYLKNYGEKEADKIYDIVKLMVIPINDSMIKEANKFKLLHQKKRYSFADCIGYVTSLMHNAKFLTGDYAFKDLKNVEFVK